MVARKAAVVAYSTFVCLAAIVASTRTTTTTTTTTIRAQEPRHWRRQLRHLNRQQEAFEQYQQQATPFVDDDESLLDRDQIALKDVLRPLMDGDVDNNDNAETVLQAASKVYNKGGHSQSFSILSLAQPMPPDLLLLLLADGTLVEGGVNNENRPIRNGQVKLWNGAAVPNNNTILSVLYQNDQPDSMCQVGGLPSEWWKKEGCLKDDVDNSTVQLQGQIWEYVAITHGNGRTLAKLSSSLQEEVLTCQNAPCGRYSRVYFQYYGEHDYADGWITAALEGKATVFARGNMDFAKLSYRERAVFVQTSTVVLNVWMYVILKLERALDSVCDNDNSNGATLFAREESTTSAPLQLWEEAKAMYTGSDDSTESGVFLYALAQDFCSDFGTCGNDTTAFVNQEWMKYWTLGRAWLLDQQQDAVPFACPKDKIEIFSKLIRRMVSLMTIPLVQGLLQSSAVIAAAVGNVKDENTRQQEAQGAAYLTALLPRIHECDTRGENKNNTAGTLYQSWNSPAGSYNDFVQIKVALESNYECLRITCDMVGSDATVGDDVPACTTTHSTNNNNNQESSSRQEGRKDQTVTAIIATVHVAIVLIVVAIMSWCMLRAQCYSTAALARPRPSLPTSSDDGGGGGGGVAAADDGHAKPAPSKPCEAPMDNNKNEKSGSEID